MIFKYLTDFEKYFDVALDMLYANTDPSLSLAKEHFMKCVRYNVPNGKKFRGLLCVAACDAFSMKKMTPEKSRAANLVGWCIEFMQSGFLIHDDLVDKSSLRRGQTTWHLLQQNEGRGLISVNDGLHIYLCVQQLLFATLSDSNQEHVLLKLIKLFGDSANFTCYGQALDLLSSDTQCTQFSDKIDGSDEFLPTAKKISKLTGRRLENIDNENFSAIAKWKTCYYSFILPVTAGMILAGVDEETLLENAKEILLKIGQYFQAQDDFLDVFADDAVTGKIGTDIVDGKCSWLIAAALERSSESQLEILEGNYGISDVASIAAVRKIFVDLDLPSVFDAYEKQMQSEISSLIDDLGTKRTISTGDEKEKIWKEFFEGILSLLHKRKK